MKSLQPLLLIVLLSILGACASPPPTPIKPIPPTVILIAFDGFRHDYLEKYDAPNLKAFVAGGFRAKSLKPVFPSLTFPNLYSIVTGLYPEHHGILANEIYDPQTKKLFALKDQKSVLDSEWWDGEPLWATAQKAGMKAATMFWVGSFAEIHGVRPTYWVEYDPKFPASSRIEKVLGWLDLPEQDRPRFITLYFGDVDIAGHAFGPDHEEMAIAVKKVDGYLGDLLGRLKERGLENQIDILIVSDHGMAAVPQDKFVSVGEHLKPGEADTVGSGALVGIWPKKSSAQTLYARLKKAKLPAAIYLKNQIPKRYHYHHKRVPPVLLVAHENYYLAPGKLDPKIPPTGTGGAHGYDNELPSMQGILFGNGPHLKKGADVGAVENINVYNAVAKLLKIKPAKNDGNHSLADKVVID